ncbi:MAG: DUF1501 domain-containing protein [Planctomycetes bacterium]|nr:DUF1501 domain-containing protein [Planctomycetota bacterium]
MDPRIERARLLTRRSFFGRSATGIGAAALANLLGQESSDDGILRAPHHPPTARRVIYLFMSGAPSQLDMWDHKPGLRELYDTDIPPSVVGGQRLTTMTSGQNRFPIAPSIFEFARHGQTGSWVSELLPYTASVVDELTVIRSLHTDAINHDPGITFVNSGHEQPGRPSMGAWVSYGLGSPNRDLPAFVVLHSSWSAKRDAQALFSRLWGSGFIPSKHQGVALRSDGDPVLHLSNPPGVSRAARRKLLDALGELNERQYAEVGDPEILSRISQYELAYRMQTSVPDLTDFSDEPEHVLEMYGPDVHRPGTFAANCVLARRLAERDVRFVQVYIRGWDQHGNLPADLRRQCRDVDQPCAALIRDLDQRGLLDDTLVVWASEFGRTTYCQGKLTTADYGRDHHPRCYTVWLAGGGTRRGAQIGQTCDFGYNITERPVHVHDLNATILHCLGIDHERLTYRFQGREFRLTDVHGHVVRDALA